jgi:peptidoglycan hydrolase-like protein with peptidoglycan-binding domain
MVQYNSSDPGGSGLPKWYTEFFDVTGTVGWGCKNHKDDVMLVQLLLRRHYMYRSNLGLSTKPALIVKVDGIFGDKTAEAIVAYQRHGGTLVDGKVDPGRTTIRSLNTMYKSEYPQYSGKPYIDPEAPPLLKQSTLLAYNAAPYDIGY